MLKPLNAERFSKPSSEFAPGPAPQLNWIDIDKLVIDHQYQRGISRRGAINIAHIADQFDWSKFAPVIVAPVEGGHFAVVDGQHRTTAAMLRGLSQVPCQIVQADRAKQAAAYAAVNGNVTKTTYTQLFHARLASGEQRSQAIAEVCAAADVVVLRTNTTLSNMKVGETSAVNALFKCYEVYGYQTLLSALRCITRTADGNAGYLRSTVIEAICIVLHKHPEWQADEETLLKYMGKFSFPDAWGAIVAGRDQIFPNTAKSDMAERLEKHLSRRYSHNSKAQAA
ncbi:ParB/RepB/Spo0J family partition protein [Bradyrhizobium prioriisuperbiae]|uniref:ParB/RepB/Spo0J family partition protein n=1 Tax=Bradyrhizobium prioriisuperbiae TaxID=2854389 RepID=UPI0028F07D43|nr:ParB/RepB/Spo0J family partition protein [Bradyrhizobium prioritasuperba]